MDRFTAYYCMRPSMSEERVKQTLSSAPSDKTVKGLICLLFDVSPLSKLQLGRVNAVCRRYHRMLKIGLSIDDYDEDLGDDGASAMLEVADERLKMEEVDCGRVRWNAAFRDFFGTARSLLRRSAGPAEGWLVGR